MHPWVQKFNPVLGLSSGGRFPRHSRLQSVPDKFESANNPAFEPSRLGQPALDTRSLSRRLPQASAGKRQSLWALVDVPSGKEQHKHDRPECSKIVHRHLLAIFHRRQGTPRNFHNGDHFPYKDRREHQALKGDFSGSGKNGSRNRIYSCDFDVLGDRPKSSNHNA